MPRTRRTHTSEKQRIHDILHAISIASERKLSEKTSIRSRMQQNKKLSTIYRSNENLGYYISKRILASTINTTMTNTTFTGSINQCEKKGWLIVLDEPSEIKALFPRNSPDSTEASHGKPILFLTKKGFERINVIRFCKYEKFDDVLKGMASEFTDEIEQQILKLAEMIGKERPNPFYQIDNPNAN